MNPYIEICKPRIVKLVLMTGVIGYALGFPLEQSFSVFHLLSFLLGLTFLSAGSLALNSAQEWEIDSKMNRTKGRPIPSGKISAERAYQFAFFSLVSGLFVLCLASLATALIGLATVLLYNGLYTSLLKRRSAFAAVPGALPGAAPVLMGYAAIHHKVFTHESVYVFLLMFLWQMPHFWALAIRYMDDYAQGGFPVLPVALGKQKTLYHMGLYIFPYIALAILSPWFVEVSYAYYFLVLPVAAISVYEFYRFLQSRGEKNWVRFFIWINLSMLFFLCAPALDRWLFYILKGVLRQ